MAGRRQPPRTKRDTAKLTVREELFAAGWIAHGNGTKAAIDAGYSAKSARAKAVELLKRPRVAAAIQAAKTRMLKKFNLSAERTLEEMSLVGFSDLRHYLIDGEPIDAVTLAPGAPDGAMRAIKRVRRKMRLIPQRDGKPSIVESETEIDLWNKDAELRGILEHLKKNPADDDDDRLTPEQWQDRAVALLKVALKRQRDAQRNAKTAS